MAHRRSRAKSPEPNSMAFGMPAFEASYRKVGFVGRRDWVAERWPLTAEPEPGDRRVILIPKSGWLIRLKPRAVGGWTAEAQVENRWRPSEQLFRRALECLKLWESFNVLPVRQLSLGDCFNEDENGTDPKES